MLMLRCICRDVFVLQEPYMEGVNPFIKNNKQRMIMFLDELGVNCYPFLKQHGLPAAQFMSSVWSSFPITFSLCCFSRMFLISRNLPSTLGLICPVTLLPCMRSVLLILTNSAPSAMREEHSRYVSLLWYMMVGHIQYIDIICIQPVINAKQILTGWSGRWHECMNWLFVITLVTKLLIILYWF